MNWYSVSGTWNIATLDAAVIILKQQRSFRLEYFSCLIYDVLTGAEYKTPLYLIAGDAAGTFKPISDQSIGGTNVDPSPHLFLPSIETVYPYVTIPAVSQLQLKPVGIFAVGPDFLFTCTMGVTPL